MLWGREWYDGCLATVALPHRRGAAHLWANVAQRMASALCGTDGLPAPSPAAQHPCMPCIAPLIAAQHPCLSSALGARQQQQLQQAPRVLWVGLRLCPQAPAAPVGGLLPCQARVSTVGFWGGLGQDARRRGCRLRLRQAARATGHGGEGGEGCQVRRGSLSDSWEWAVPYPLTHITALGWV